MELAALSGCDSISVVKGFPLARGLGLQLSFRDHPYLGLVAVYDQYLIEDDESVKSPARKISLLPRYQYVATHAADTYVDAVQIHANATYYTLQASSASKTCSWKV